MKLLNEDAGLRTLLKAGIGLCNAPANLLTVCENPSVTLSIFFYDSDLIVSHLYSSLKPTASESILKTQRSPKGPNPTPIQINSLQWSLFVASQQD